MLGADLSGLPIFVAWQLEPMEGDAQRLVKAPYQVHGALRWAKVNDPAGWGTLAQADAQAGRLPMPLGSGGVGIILGPKTIGNQRLVLIGVDLDSCRSATDGTTAPFAQGVIDALGSYTEVSPSGTGYHILALVEPAAVPVFMARYNNKCIWKKGGGDHPPSCEWYTGGRYFTLDQLGFLAGEIRIITLEEMVAGAEVAVEWAGGRADRAKDRSRSAAALKLALAMVRAGKAYADFIPTMLADQVLAGWYREKGSKLNDREVERTWAKAEEYVATGTDEQLIELNEQFAVLTLKDKTVILKEGVDAQGRPSLAMLSKDSVKLLLMNRKILIGTKLLPLADIWLAWADRREYRGITFQPSGAPEGYYNHWRGWAIQPDPAGSCALFKKHLLDNVCGGHRGRYLWLFGWFADIFQNPEGKKGTSLVLRGDQGVGKSIVGNVFGLLLGDHYVQTGNARFVTGQFNSHLSAALLLHCDEAFWAGDKRAESILKDLITSRVHMIERKGIDQYAMPNHTRVFITGDQDWLIPAGPRERRFSLYDVADGNIQDRRYFQAIMAELEAGGYERLLHELQTFDLSQVDLGVIPVGTGLLDQKTASFNPEQGWYFDLLKEGKLPFGCEDPHTCPTKALFDLYIEHAQRQGARRRSIEVQIGDFIRKMVGPQFRIFRQNYKINQFDQERGHVYMFPSLQDCRTRFTEFVNQTIVWGDEDEGERDWEKTLPRLQAVTTF